MARIPGSSAGGYASQQQAARLTDMRAQLADLGRQLATGRRSETLAGLPTGRPRILDFQARLAETETYAQLNLRGRERLTTMIGALDRFDGLAKASRGELALASAVTTTGAVQAAARAGQARLGEALGLLNSDFDGQFLFSGRAASTRSVIEPGALLDGDGARAGLRALITERQQADLGDGKGRMITALVGQTVSLTEEAAGLPFGFKIAGLGGVMSGAVLTGPGGAPAGVSIAITALPLEGERILIDLDLPDGSRETLALAARSTGPAASADGSFLIGSDSFASAANLKAAIDLALTARAASALAAASAMTAADDLTDGSSSTPVRRIAGPPFATATAFAAAGARPTVTWYAGDDDASADARASQVAPADRGLNLDVGARADEPALRRAISGFAALAAETGAGGDAVASARYQALAGRVAGRLAGAQQGQELRDISVELSFASVAMGEAKERLALRKAFQEGVLAEIQTPSVEELSAAILSLQTRLQASYQTTASLARLNLSDYLR